MYRSFNRVLIMVVSNGVADIQEAHNKCGCMTVFC